MEKKMEEINIIKQNYLYRKDIHRLIGKDEILMIMFEE